MRLKTSRITFITSQGHGQGRVGQVVRGGVSGLSGEDEPAVECRRENQGDEWSRQGDQQFLPGLVGHSLQPGDSSDRKQDHIGSPDPESPGHEDVAEFMEEDAGEQGEEQNGGVNRPGAPAFLVSAHRPPGDEQKEGEVHLDVGARDPGDAKGPVHCESSR